MDIKNTEKKNIEDYVVYEELSGQDKWAYDRLPYLFNTKKQTKLHKIYEEMGLNEKLQKEELQKEELQKEELQKEELQKESIKIEEIIDA